MQDSFYDAKITIRSFFNFVDEDEEVEEIYEGKVRSVNGKIEMLYTDSIDRRTKLTCVGKLFEKRVLGCPFEPFRAEPGKNHDFVHSTPYGDFDLTCSCTWLEVKDHEDRIEINMTYYLNTDEDELKRINMSIISERGKT